MSCYRKLHSGGSNAALSRQRLADCFPVTAAVCSGVGVDQECKKKKHTDLNFMYKYFFPQFGRLLFHPSALAAL